MKDKYGFVISNLPSCGRHGILGDVGPSIVGYQQDHECFSGVWMDADVFHEGYLPDTIYGPCKCNPKHCTNCGGHGSIVDGSIVDGSIVDDNLYLCDCDVCGGTGWIGAAEHPDSRYASAFVKAWMAIKRYLFDIFNLVVRQ